jgi:16S rRNA processing protein RimM
LTARQRIVVGKISGVFGIKGWVKVFSYTAPRENILNYSPWILTKNDETREVEVVTGNRQGKTIVAQLAGVNDRDAAAKQCGWQISIAYEQLPAIQENEYYWADLVGLKVITTAGVELGRVNYLLETGANDVLVVAGERERLIPFLQGSTIINVDLDVGVVTVDWDPEF